LQAKLFKEVAISDAQEKKRKIVARGYVRDFEPAAIEYTVELVQYSAHA
jgi:hypothetical protein